jgi:hypothetical protein
MLQRHNSGIDDCINTITMTYVIYSKFTMKNLFVNTDSHAESVEIYIAHSVEL